LGNDPTTSLVLIGQRKAEATADYDSEVEQKEMAVRFDGDIERVSYKGHRMTGTVKGLR
jgi:hypothetical protein